MFSDLPFLSLTLFMPLFGVLFILLIRVAPVPKTLSFEQLQRMDKNAWAVGLCTSGATFIFSMIMAFLFRPEKEGFQMVDRLHAMGPLGMGYHMGVDGISLMFVLLTTLITPIALLASKKVIKEKVSTYVICFLVLETFLIGSFCSLDLFFFYLFFEGVLLPMFLIIGIWGGEGRFYASFKFFLYTFLGSVFMLLAMIFIAQKAGTTSLPMLKALDVSLEAQHLLWLAFFLSFAVKVPMWPFHTWLPHAHVQAPTAGSVLLAGLMLKLGGYGFLRFSLTLFPQASMTFAPMMYGLALVALIYTSMVAYVQRDMKKLIAYSSVAHMGMAVFGLFSFNLHGITGAVFQMISHGLVSAALFLCVGVLYDRLHTRELDRFGGLARTMPHFATVLVFFSFASAGLPGTSSFVAEILILMSSFEISGLWTLGLGFGMIVGALYALKLVKDVLFGPLDKEDLKPLTDITWTEKLTLYPLFVLVLFLGFYPQPILGFIQAPLSKIVSSYVQESSLKTSFSP